MELNQIENLDAGMPLLDKVLMSPNDANKGKFWIAWHYLQVYSTWGLNLPHVTSDLVKYLNIEDLSKYTFFNTMLGAYQTINESSLDFRTNVQPRVVKFCYLLKEFAEDNRSGDDSVWTFILEMVDDEENYSDLFDLIQDLQDQATENVNEAARIAKLLSGYSGKLDIALGKLKIAGDAVESDQKTSKETIKLLQSGSDVMGSIAQIQELADSQSEAYETNKVIAATTLSYAWVPVIGTIAAAVVAGVFGDKAVKALNNYKDAMNSLTKEKSELKTAIKAHEVQNLANVGISNASKNTKLALQHVSTVQNAWADLASNLNVIKTKVNDMTKTKDEQIILKGKGNIKRYAKQSRRAWDKIWPSIKELTDQPYITMENEEKSIDQVITEVEMALADPASSN